MPAPREPKVHYATLVGNAFCGAVNRDEVTARPRLVTCEKCRESPAYKAMMELG